MLKEYNLHGDIINIVESSLHGHKQKNHHWYKRCYIAIKKHQYIVKRKPLSPEELLQLNDIIHWARQCVA